MQQQTLNTFAYDYMFSVEAARFISSPDSLWPKQNIEPSLASFKINGVWIFSADRKLVYGTSDSTLGESVRPSPAALEALSRNRLNHFFTFDNNIPIEYRGVVIYPAGDTGRTTRPLGFFFAARVWNDDFVWNLSRLTDCTIGLKNGKPQIKPGLHLHDVQFDYVLAGLDDLPAATLTVTAEPFALKNYRRITIMQMVLLIAFSSTAVVLILLLLNIWVGTPLRILLKSLHTEDPTYLRKLSSGSREFKQLSSLVEKSFKHKNELLSEIAERKKTETALRQSEQRYRSLVEISPDAIFLIDSQFAIKFCNRHAVEMSGYGDPGELQGRRLFELFSNDNHRILDLHLQEVKKESRSKTEEYTFIRKDGSGIPVEFSISPMDDREDGIEAHIATIRDITARKRTEFENMRLQEQFRAVYKMEAIGQLAGGVAHDFNNILGAISGYADIIRQRYMNDPKLDKYAGMILSAATRAADLTSKLLTFARKGKLQMIPFNVHQVLSDAAEILERTIEKSIRISQNLEAKNPIVTGDPGQFQSAVMNLALNARDAMPNGGEILFSTRDLALDENFARSKAYVVTPGPYLQVMVTDTGAGMDKQVIAHLFEPFFTTKEVGKGTGLGLASVYGTVKSHNGYIDVSSDPGKGSVFSMYFPANAPTSLLSRVSSSPPMLKGRGNILVVDDEAFLRDALREMLTWLGYAVTTCRNGTEGIEYYRTNHEKIDLVVLDMMMPGMNGRECFKILKQINPAVKVLLATGYSIEEERLTLLKDGLAGIIQKPFMSAQLAKAVHDSFGS